MNSRLGKRDVRLRGRVRWRRRVQRVAAMFAVEAPRGLRGFPLFQPRVYPPGTGQVARAGCGRAGARDVAHHPAAASRQPGRMNSRLGKRDVRLRGPVRWHRNVQRVAAGFAVEAPRSLRGFPLLLRRIHSLSRAGFA
ncbi:MAG TPA: hypothetical protein VGC13_13635 [Longimicrobium sp.]|jgi:hypothetical protein|uniref:hypothetical protein n=1 Tax=Longimicrobium sp. TaxID=2029185 RepID=UPI002EDA258C